MSHSTTKDRTTEQMLSVIRDLQGKRISADEARSQMGRIKARVGEATYRAAHTSAVVRMSREVV